MQDVVDIICPYCGQRIDIFIDYSGGVYQSYIEDCQVCCQPLQLQIDLSEEEPVVFANPTEE